MSPVARCKCCRRYLPRVDCPDSACHTCLALCEEWRPCTVREALELAARAPSGGWMVRP